MTQGALSHNFYSVSIGIMVAAPTSFNPKDDLIPTSIININEVSLPRELDTIEEGTLENLRKAWLDSLDRPEVSLTEKSHAPEDIITCVLSKMAKTANKDVLRQILSTIAVPIPADYTIAIPMMDKEDRKFLISSLVPFQNTQASLLRLEDELELPMRVVRIASEVTQHFDPDVISFTRH